MTRFRSLSSREMVESPRERLSRISKETRRELEEREGKEKNATSCKLGWWAWITPWNRAWTSKGAPSSSFYSFSIFSLSVLLEVQLPLHLVTLCSTITTIRSLTSNWNSSFPFLVQIELVKIQSWASVGTTRDSIESWLQLGHRDPTSHVQSGPTVNCK